MILIKKSINYGAKLWRGWKCTESSNAVNARSTTPAELLTRSSSIYNLFPSWLSRIRPHRVLMASHFSLSMHPWTNKQNKSAGSIRTHKVSSAHLPCMDACGCWCNGCWWETSSSAMDCFNVSCPFYALYLSKSTTNLLSSPSVCDVSGTNGLFPPPLTRLSSLHHP